MVKGPVKSNSECSVKCPLNINTLKAGMANIISGRPIPISLSFKLSAPKIMQLKWNAEQQILVKDILFCDEPPFM